MMKNFLRCALLAALVVGMSVIPASAGELKLSMQNGRVTLVADNVPVRQILQEWARIGQTRIINLERLSGPNVTLQLVDTPEKDALDILLRSASGYIAAPRTEQVANAAIYDRITIFMSTSRPPAQVVSSAPTPTFQRPPQPDDNDEPINVQMPPQMVNPANPVTQPYPGMPPQPQPNMPPGFQPALPGQMPQQLPAGNQAPGPLTAPRPGALPQPMLPGAPNPYQPPVRPGGGPGGGPGGVVGGGPGVK
jgi:hypothetical protein